MPLPIIGALLVGVSLGALVGWLVRASAGSSHDTLLARERDAAREALAAAQAELKAEREGADSPAPVQAVDPDAHEQLQLKHDVLAQRIRETEAALEVCKDRCNKLRERADVAKALEKQLASARRRVDELERRLDANPSNPPTGLAFSEAPTFSDEMNEPDEVDEPVEPPPVVQTPVQTEVQTPSTLVEQAADVHTPDDTGELQTEPVQEPPVAQDHDEQPDDLRRIAGIGPKTERLLQDNGVQTYAQLAALSPDEVRVFLAQGGAHMARYDPSPWIAEAAALSED